MVGLHLLQRAQKAAAAMTVKAAELVLVRHGETDWNKGHRLQGQQQPGPPLNQRGWQQCDLVSSRALAQAALACKQHRCQLQQSLQLTTGVAVSAALLPALLMHLSMTSVPLHEQLAVIRIACCSNMNSTLRCPCSLFHSFVLSQVSSLHCLVFSAAGVLSCMQLRGVLQQRFTHFDAVVSSDLLRTVQTAQVLAAAYNLQVQPRQLARMLASIAS
jgi:phosphohistidine phosphatase SixA